MTTLRSPTTGRSPPTPAPAGARIVALNPGVVPARGYFDVADVVVTFEGPFADYDDRVEPDWLERIEPERIAHLVYGASPEQARRSRGRLYVTSGTLPHPWGTVAGGMRVTGSGAQPVGAGTPTAVMPTSTPPIREAA